MARLNHEKQSRKRKASVSVLEKKPFKESKATDKQKQLMDKLGIEYSNHTTKIVAMNLIKQQLDLNKEYNQFENQAINTTKKVISTDKKVIKTILRKCNKIE